MNSKKLSLKLWGTRGTLTPKHKSQTFGIHTTCVQVIGGPGAPLLFDLGSGATVAGDKLIHQGAREFDVFLSHLHSDHVSGVYGFLPFFRKDCKVHLRASGHDPRAAVHDLFADAFHPLTFEEIEDHVTFDVLPSEGSLRFEDRGLTVSWVPIPHPQGCSAFRIDDGDNAVVFATDVELAVRDRLSGLKTLLSSPYPAGLMVVDGFLQPDEVVTYAGWGHSSWEQAMQLATECEIDTIVITHHHPAHTDSKLEAIAQRGRPAVWGRDGDLFELSRNKAKLL